MGSHKCGIVGGSQSVLMKIDPIISPCTRIVVLVGTVGRLACFEQLLEDGRAEACPTRLVSY
jgi:hypothetical protein